MNIERKTKGLALLSLVIIAAIASGILLTTQASNASATVAENDQSRYETQLAVLTTTASDTTEEDSTDTITGDATIISGFDDGHMGFGRKCRGFGGGGFGGFGPIEVSDEYEEAVTTIAESDTDVQELLADGYNVTKVMPIIKTVIDAEGNIATKATNAKVVLEKDISGIAFVSVDLAQDKVTQIIIYTRTVIEK